jgi:uncharacterized protein (DUF2461 family)
VPSSSPADSLLPPGLEPLDRPPGQLTRPSRLDLTFEGWTTQSIAVLERLRQHPHVEQYRADKADLKAHVQDPFTRYRDDLAWNWVLPNRLPFETQKGVFSRILKNDFGAGGSHHHLWMSFYRHSRKKRLQDFQLAHSLDPDGFTVGLFVADHMRGLMPAVKARIAREPQAFLDAVNPALGRADWQLGVRFGSKGELVRHAKPLSEVPAELARAKTIWLRTKLPTPEVLRLGPDLVGWAIEQLEACWPLYVFYLDAEADSE